MTTKTTFTQEQLDEIVAELEEARQHKQHRAAFGSIIRRYYHIFRSMETHERLQFLRYVDIRPSYSTEINKELAGKAYDENR